MKKNSIETYLAYRLPYQEQAFFLKGSTKKVTSLKDCPPKAFILNSFDSKEIIIIEDLKEIEEHTFQIFHNIPTDLNQTKKDYKNWFDQLIKEIRDGRFEKVILSRTKKVETTKSSLTIFNDLNANYKNTFNYIVSNKEIGTWIGATPETLIHIKDDHLTTMALAGTKTKDAVWTEKEKEEQLLVTNSIINGLETTKCQAISAIGPTTIQAGKVFHLHTKITAQLTDSESWKSVIEQLHPTPAVCGIPKKEALEYIQTLEGHNRKFYTGFIGLVAPNSKHFFVNLRCMEHHNGIAKLYLGGGITAPSNQEDEWLETERKALTLEQILHS